jgi:ATP-dependent exoDNAse (exonuclease V) beta subunit
MRQLSLDLLPERRGADAAGAPALTAQQELAASMRKGSMLLAAAAGSGKTSVLVERYVRALIEDGIAPGRILAITFTERAAWEMKERVRSRLLTLDRRALALDAEAASIGTIHGLCASLLRADPLAADLTPGFAIVDEPAAARMRAVAFAKALAATVSLASSLELDLAAAYGPDRLRRIVISAYGELRSRGEARPALPVPAAGSARATGLAHEENGAVRGLAAENAAASGLAAENAAASGLAAENAAVPAPALALGAHRLLNALLQRFGDIYEHDKRARGVVDFDDLELGALRLLERDPATAGMWAQRFEMLLVDEFQDTNRRQLRLLQALQRDNLFTVGDEWQSIYGFRHAEVEIFRQREAELAKRGASLELTRNFRSRPGVLEAVNAAFAHRFGERFKPLVPARGRTVAPDDGAPVADVEVLLTDAEGWQDEQLISEGLPAAPAWRRAEARLIASRVAELIAERRACPGQIAVLLRSMSDLAVYEGALRAWGVPTSSATADLWETQEVQDTIACLRALANPLDELALCGLLAGPAASLSADALGLLCRASRAEPARSLWEAICDAESPLAKRERERVISVRDRVLGERSRAGERSLAELVRVAAGLACVDVVGGDVGACPDGRCPGSAGVRGLVRIASDFEALEGRDLRSFIDHLQQLEQARAAVAGEPLAPDGEAVRLMSIHAAKGLEFPVVCIADLGRLPGGRETPDLLVDDSRVGVRVAHLDGAPPEPAFEFQQLRQERDLAASQEEDRVLYVGMTRAKELLLLSGAMSFERWPKDDPRCPPIAWLAPALIDDLGAQLASAAGDEPSSVVACIAPGDRRKAFCVLRTATSLRAQRLAAPQRAAPEPAAPLDAPHRADPGLAAQLDASRGAAPGLAAQLDAPQLAAPRPVASGAPAMQATERRRRTDAEILGDGALSYSALAELERCGYRYHLERVIRLPRDERPFERSGGDRRSRTSSISAAKARLAGVVAHRLLETLDFRRGVDLSVDEVHRCAAALGAEIEPAAASEMAAMLGGLDATPTARRLAAAKRVRTEQPFCFTLDQGARSMVGTFDAIATERDGRLLVVDYKTGAVADADGLAEHATREYGLQRLIYALAALRDGASEVEVVHWFLHRPSEPVGVCFLADRLPELESQLSARIEAAIGRGFEVSAKPNWRLCAGCPGRATLCSWPAEMTMRELAVGGLRGGG